MSEPIAKLYISPTRRVFALFVLISLGALLFWIAMVEAETDPIWRLVLVGAGLIALIQADRFRRATQIHLVLRAEGLFDSNGVLLAPFDQIIKVERGAFAFKPSNGFLIKLTEAHGRLWAPGLYWRMGKSVGVGGVTNASAAKALAETIAIMLASRAAQADDQDAD